MRRLGLISWAYVLALLPLCAGSVFFFFWYYQRNWNAVSANIYVGAAISILMYIILGVAAVTLCVVALAKKREHWSRVIGPLLILVATWFVIALYDTYFNTDDRAYLRVDVRASDITEVTLWSAHFSQGMRKDPRDEPLVFVFDPVYTYDWGMPGSSMTEDFVFKVDSVFIELHEKSVVSTYVLPPLLKGECLRLSKDDINSLPKARNKVEIYGDPQLIY